MAALKDARRRRLVSAILSSGIAGKAIAGKVTAGKVTAGKAWAWQGSACHALGRKAAARLATRWRAGSAARSGRLVLRALVLRALVLLVLPGLLAACASQPAYRTAEDYAQSSSRNYPPPGPPEDPWGPYIREAANRFGVPQQWVRAVMHQESGGHTFQNGHPIVSSAGAMGLMQVMPATYDMLRDQFGLGQDPYDPHNSILAGTAYIRQMYDKYGAPGFLAAYNAGPQRLDDYLAGASSLPNETVNYLAAITPHLGRDRPMSGPLAAYADASQPVADRPAALPGIGRAGAVRLASARLGSSRPGARGGCVRDPDAAFDAPCGTPARPPQPEVLPMQVAAAPPAGPGCVRDPDAAFDSPCGSVAPRPLVQEAAFVPSASAGCPRDPDAAFDSPCAPSAAPPRSMAPARPVTAVWQSAPSYEPRPSYAPPPAAPAASPGFGMRLASLAIPAAQAAPAVPAAQAASAARLAAPTGGEWAVQVGAFTNPGQARQTADAARQMAPTLGAARPVVGTTTPFGGNVLYRARLAGLSSQQAAEGCLQLQRQHLQCMTVAPGT